jgi:hypothetical protein
MARWPVIEAREEKVEEEEERTTLTRRPGAYLAGMARQCPRGRPGAADQARPREVFTGGGVAAQGAPVGDASTCAAQPPKHRTTNTGKRSGKVSSSEATRAGETRAGSSSGSPRRGGVFQIHFVGKEEDTEAIILPKVAAAEDAEGGRNHRATARRLGFARESSGERERK